jgi:hypothetical protein
LVNKFSCGIATGTPRSLGLSFRYLIRHLTKLLQCYSIDRTIVYARFTPATFSKSQYDRSTGEITSPLANQLELFPEGHDFFDDIVMSALVMERKRLTS